MHWYPLFRWFEHTSIGTHIRVSTYMFPAIEVVHLLGLVLLFGTLIVVDLRLMGLGMRRQTVTRVASEVAPWTQIGIATMILTGIPLFLSEATKCYDNVAFWFKMSFLAAALLFHYTAYRKVTSTDKVRPLWARTTAVLSLVLWFGVGLGGRAIAFV